MAGSAVLGDMNTPVPTRRQLIIGIGAGSVLAAGAGAAAYASGLPSSLFNAAKSAATGATSSGSGTVVAAGSSSSVPASSVFAPTTLHEVTLGVTQADFETLITAYNASKAKDWVEGSTTIDGTEHARVGLRLKGNSTIFRVADGSPASAYPWLVRLDKSVKGADASIDGVTDIVVRTNNSRTSLNEAVALDLAARCGLVMQQAAYAVVQVADAAPVLRLLVENPGDAWAKRMFGADVGGQGLLYKAEASGDYSYRGTDATAYEDVFDQESGEDDLTPLTDFLQFINESSDADFAAGIGERFDLEAFATYRAFEKLIDNYDAIDGPGNNSYLWWERASSRMTVIGWDHNLTFGVSNRPGAGGAGGGAARPRGGGVGAAGGAKGGPGGKTNVLVTRVEKLSDWADRYSAATTAVQKVLTEQGPAVLDQWAGLLTAKATDLVSAATVQSDRAVIAPYLGG